MNKINKLYIFHEYGANNHYRALSWYTDSNLEYEIVYREFSILKKFAKGFLRADFELIKKQFQNLKFIFELMLTRNKTIIIGIAPYDWRLALLLPFLKKHDYYYHTSNTFWDYSIYPKRLFAETNVVRKLWNLFIVKANGIFCVTEKAAEGILDCYTVSKVQVVNHSIVSLYNLLPAEINFDKSTEKLNCLFSGRITQSKGISIIMKLIESLSEEQFSFTFVGDGDMKEELIKFIENKNNCSYLGFIQNPELIEIYKSADVLLQPSLKTSTWEELFGMSIIEGMACATIPIATNHSGPKEIIEHDKAGYLFLEDDYLKRTENILKLLFGDDKRMKQIKEAAYLDSQKYRAENIFSKWNEYLHI